MAQGKSSFEKIILTHNKKVRERKERAIEPRIYGNSLF